jgi:hypothetical protein
MHRDTGSKYPFQRRSPLTAEMLAFGLVYTAHCRVFEGSLGLSKADRSGFTNTACSVWMLWGGRVEDVNNKPVHELKGQHAGCVDGMQHMRVVVSKRHASRDDVQHVRSCCMGTKPSS